MEFESFGKIPRLHRDIVVTEKIDGTNAQINIVRIDDVDTVPDNMLIASPGPNGDLYGVLVGSRKRWITPDDDNFGFARWVEANLFEIVDLLGEGKHFGEWYGQGIQRGYGMKEKRFALFNTARWTDAIHVPDHPDRVDVSPLMDVAPILYEGDFKTERIDWCIDVLREGGSWIAPGFNNPEGVIVYHTQGNLMFKQTIHGDDKPKGVK